MSDYNDAYNEGWDTAMAQVKARMQKLCNETADPSDRLKIGMVARAVGVEINMLETPVPQPPPPVATPPGWKLDF